MAVGAKSLRAGRERGSQMRRQGASPVPGRYQRRLPSVQEGCGDERKGCGGGHHVPEVLLADDGIVLGVHLLGGQAGEVESYWL